MILKPFDSMNLREKKMETKYSPVSLHLHKNGFRSFAVDKNSLLALNFDAIRLKNPNKSGHESLYLG